ncbi:hypothetical protein BC828DRAFT_383454 [Blastocladiella britannica]|nr:hypothetical protein BC828DRAFT_383454 [Blastocladiella britannica]
MSSALDSSGPSAVKRRTNASANSADNTPTNADLLDDDSAILDEEQQQALLAEFMTDGLALDQAFKVVMLALCGTCVFLSSAQVYHAVFRGGAGIPMVGVATTMHPYPELGYITTAAPFAFLMAYLFYDLRELNRDPPDYMAAIRRNTALAKGLMVMIAVAWINLSATLLRGQFGTVPEGSSADASMWDKVWWAVPMMMFSVFWYSVKEMVRVASEILDLEGLQYKLKGA